MKNKKITFVAFGIFLIWATLAGQNAKADSYPSVPSSPYPAHLSSGISTSPTLSWSNTVSSGGWYHLYYKKSSDLAYIPVSSLTTNSYALTGLSQGTTYDWNIRACNPGVLCADSETWSFTTGSGASGTTTPVPTLIFSASASQIYSGGSATLSWSSANTTSCSAVASPLNTQWVGTKAISGYEYITNLAATTNFALTCAGAGGSTTQNATITVTAPTNISIFILSPNGGEMWKSGEIRRISWNPAGVSSVQIYIYDSNISGSGSTNYITPNNTPISAILGYYDWTIPPLNQLPGGGSSNYRIRVVDAGNATVKDESDKPFSIISTTATTPSTTCNSTSYTTYNTVYDFGVAGGTWSNLCGNEQYFKLTVPQNQICDLKWTLRPDYSSDYDLYVRWGARSLGRTAYEDRSVNGRGLTDELTKTRLASGSYYAMAYKEQSSVGPYSITASLLNCETLTPTTTQPTTPTPTSQTSAEITQLQSQISQLLAQINQLQAELTKLKNGGTTTGTTASSQQQTTTGNTTSSSAAWCYTFNAKLKYTDSGYAVGALQAALQKEGFFPNKLDAYFGATTLNAVVAFQEKYKSEILSPYNLSKGTGFVGTTTIAKLNSLYGCE